MKPKVLVFKKGDALSKMEKRLYKDTVLEVINKFTHVGLLFSMQLPFD